MKTILRHVIARKIIFSILVLTSMLTAGVRVSASSSTNTVDTESSVMTNSHSDVDTNPIVPLIQFSDVPLSIAIENLTLQSDINYVLDPRIQNWWSTPDGAGKMTHEPSLTLRWEKMTTRDALTKLLTIHNLVLVQDPTTTVAWITYTNQAIPHMDASLLDHGTNDAPVPLVQMSEVPLRDVLANLVKYDDMHAVIDPALFDNGITIGKKHLPEPQVSIRWQNLSTRQTIIALCQCYNLVIIKDSGTGKIEIRPGK